jgi:dTDP-4-dehydrorhamnose reductase
VKSLRVLILGASGLIGSGLFIQLSRLISCEVLALVRNTNDKKLFHNILHKNIIYYPDFNDLGALKKKLTEIQPTVIINCIGVTKHSKSIENQSLSIFINSILPIRLSEICRKQDIKFIHISTDCVFSGSKGNYTDYDQADSLEFYGRTKALGEMCEQSALILRTSTIGHENKYKYGLLEWFLCQRSSCNGYTEAFFSGLTTHEFGNILANIIMNHHHLYGIFNAGSEKISKFDLLNFIAIEYNLDIDIQPSSKLKIDRSLISQKLFDRIGYIPKPWPQQLAELRLNQHLYHPK